MGMNKMLPNPNAFHLWMRKCSRTPTLFFILSHVDEKNAPEPQRFLFLGNVDEQHVPEPQRFLFLIFLDF